MKKTIPAQKTQKPKRRTKAENTDLIKLAVIEDLFKEMQKGVSVNEFFKQDKRCARITIFDFISANPELSDRYTRARESLADAYFEKIFEIAEEPVTDNVQVQRNRLRADTLKWVVCKMIPRKYGDKIDFTSGGEKVEGIVYLPQKNGEK